MCTRSSFLLVAMIATIPTQAQMVQKCCGTGNSTFMLGNLATASHSQIIYTPADLTGEQAGEIDRIYYRYGSTGQTTGNTLTNLMIRLVQTTATTFAGGNTFFTGLDTVFTSSTYTIPPGITGDWFYFDLGTTFIYDETLTLVVDISFTGSTNTSFGTASTTMAGRKLYWSDNTSPTGQSVVSSYQDIGFDLQLPVGIDTPEQVKFKLFPNPANERVHLKFNASLSNAGKIRLMDAVGNLIMVKDLVAGRLLHSIDVADLPDGLYFIQIVSSTLGSSSQRLVLAR